VEELLEWKDMNMFVIVVGEIQAHGWQGTLGGHTVRHRWRPAVLEIETDTNDHQRDKYQLS
jgi:hypothetical protein